MENLTVNFQLPAAAVFVPLMLTTDTAIITAATEQLRKTTDID